MFADESEELPMESVTISVSTSTGQDVTINDFFEKDKQRNIESDLAVLLAKSIAKMCLCYRVSPDDVSRAYADLLNK